MVNSIVNKENIATQNNLIIFNWINGDKTILLLDENPFTILFYKAGAHHPNENRFPTKVINHVAHIKVK
jgi:hypothetical protein